MSTNANIHFLYGGKKLFTKMVATDGYFSYTGVKLIECLTMYGNDIDFIKNIQLEEFDSKLYDRIMSEYSERQKHNQLLAEKYYRKALPDPLIDLGVSIDEFFNILISMRPSKFQTYGEDGYSDPYFEYYIDIKSKTLKMVDHCKDINFNFDYNLFNEEYLKSSVIGITIEEDDEVITPFERVGKMDSLFPFMVIF